MILCQGFNTRFFNNIRNHTKIKKSRLNRKISIFSRRKKNLIFSPKLAGSLKSGKKVELSKFKKYFGRNSSTFKTQKSNQNLTDFLEKFIFLQKINPNIGIENIKPENGQKLCDHNSIGENIMSTRLFLSLPIH